MKSLKFKIALLVGGTIALLMIVLMTVCNLMIRDRIMTLAADSVDAWRESSPSEQDLNYKVDSFDVTFASAVTAETSGEMSDWYADTVQNGDGEELFGLWAEVAAFCEENDTEDGVLAGIDGKTLYVRQTTETKDSVYVLPVSQAGAAFDDSGLGWYMDLMIILPYFIDGQAYAEAMRNSNPAEHADMTLEEFLACLDELGADYCVAEEQLGHIYFVDLTREFRILRDVDLFFLLIAFVVLCAGCFIGWRLGDRLEKNRLAEKRFFENTSHELKTPLTAIRGYAEGVGTGVIADRRRAARVIREQTDEMSRLAEDILYRADLETGVAAPQRETFSLAQAVRNSLAPFEGAIAMKQLEVSLDLEDAGISADPDQLGHALSNLIANAVRHAASRIRITNRDRRLTVWNDVAAAAAPELRHMFDRYYIGPNGSTGIGLSLVRSIVENNGWRISAAAEQDGLGITVELR